MKSKKILVLAPHCINRAPSQRLKYEQYFDHWNSEGFTVENRPFISDSFNKIIYKKGFTFKKIGFTFLGYLERFRNIFEIKNYDIVYIHLWVTPFGFPFFEWLVCKVAKKIIYDIDDLVFLNNPGQKSIIANLKGKGKAVFLMKAANHVITCTPRLDDFARKYNPHTTDISSTINIETYIAKTDYSIKEKLVLGWSGSHSTARYLYELKDALLKLRKEIDFKLLVIGDENFEIKGIEVESLPWNLNTEVSDLRRIDIGLYPVPEEEWVHGKSGLKALQYMALGIPTLATNYGTINRVIDNRKDGFLIPLSEDEIWKSRILELNSDLELRRKIGVEARAKVRKKFSVEVTKHIYLTILKNVIKVN